MAVSYTQYREDKVSFGIICFIDYGSFIVGIICTGMIKKICLLLCRSGTVQRKPENP